MMLEKINPRTNPFQSKIVPYLDGSLSADDKAEFEAYVMTHPEFEEEIKSRKDEMALIQSLIPTALMSKASEISLENEIRTSIFNLLKPEPQNLWERVKSQLEEWLSR